MRGRSKAVDIDLYNGDILLSTHQAFVKCPHEVTLVPAPGEALVQLVWAASLKQATDGGQRGLLHWCTGSAGVGCPLRTRWPVLLLAPRQALIRVAPLHLCTPAPQGCPPALAGSSPLRRSTAACPSRSRPSRPPCRRTWTPSSPRACPSWCTPSPTSARRLRGVCAGTRRRRQASNWLGGRAGWAGAQQLARLPLLGACAALDGQAQSCAGGTIVCWCSLLPHHLTRARWPAAGRALKQLVLALRVKLAKLKRRAAAGEHPVGRLQLMSAPHSVGRLQLMSAECSSCNQRHIAAASLKLLYVACPGDQSALEQVEATRAALLDAEERLSAGGRGWVEPGALLCARPALALLLRLGHNAMWLCYRTPSSLLLGCIQHMS